MLNYQEVLDFLYSQLPMYQRVGKSAFKKDLTNTLKLSEGLNNPHQFFKTIHVAGTNGKGSTSHMLASILDASGYKVGLYTSPHLKSFRERIRVNGVEISEKYITRFVNDHKSLIEEVMPSFFEITVVMAFSYFADQKVDIAVIETGLGGRLDSTNIINPMLSIITSISRDHEDMLGSSLKAIANEKAGIIKPHVPIVIGELPEEARKTIKEVAIERQSKLIVSSTIKELPFSECDMAPAVIKLNFNTVKNAVSELSERGLDISDQAFELGVKEVVARTGLKGRWQQLKKEPKVYCDVGHNEEAVKWLMSEIEKLEFRKLHIVWGAVEDKAIEKILPLLIRDCNYYFCAADVPRAMNVSQLEKVALDFGLKGKAYASVEAAYTRALENAHADDLVFVGGSTFVVAELKDL